MTPFARNMRKRSAKCVFFEKIDPILAATFWGSFKHPWFCSHFFPLFFPPFLGGDVGFALELVPRAPRNTGGSACCVFFLCKRGGEPTCDIFAPNTGGKRFFLPLFWRCFWVFGSFTDFGWVGFRKGSSRSNESRGTWRRRRSRGHKEEQKKKEEEEENDEE